MTHVGVKGKGSIEFIDWNGEPKTMSEVYFISDLKSNIISLGEATDSGCNVKMKEEYLIMHDCYGKSLTKAIRSRNLLYMGDKRKCLLTLNIDM